jgi:hypothetical protein
MTNSPANSPAAPVEKYRRFDSFKEYEALFDTLIPQTETNIRVFERALPAAWNSPQRTQLLRHFLRRNPLNRLYVVLHDPGNIASNQARVVELNRDFGHAFKLRQTPKMARHLYDPFALFDATHYLHRFHHAHMRAASGTHDMEGSQVLLDRFLELWDVSVPIHLDAPAGL